MAAPSGTELAPVSYAIIEEAKMTFSKLLTAAAVSALVAGTAQAATIGYSSPNFDDNYQTIMREAAKEHAESLGHEILIEDAREDVGTQLSQIQNFIASGVDAIVLAPVSTEATPAITEMVKAAGIPLAYINRRPVDVDTLGGMTTYVGSDNYNAGLLEGEAACAAADGKGTAVLLIGFLRNEDAQARTKAVKDVLATDACSGIEIVAEQEAEWQRTKGNDVMANWLASGVTPDVVFANNDEMALGAIQALKGAGVSMDDVIVAGVDATADALKSMEQGDLDVTVFQDAVGQAQGGINAALAMIDGEEQPSYVDIPFVAVTPENIADFK